MASDSDLGESSRVGQQLTGVESIELGAVDFADSTYRISTRTDSAELIESIDRFGVLVPPLVQAKGKSFRVISGFLRLEACQTLGIGATPVRLISPGSSDLDCAHCAIAENRLQRALNWLETARAVALLASVVTGKGELAFEAAAAGLPDNQDMITKLLRVVKMPADVQMRLAEGAIGLAMALTLDREKDEFSTKCANVFGDLRIGLNRQREILLLLTEIAARDDLLPLDIVQDEAIEEILTHADLDRPLKVNRIRDWLYHRRYPNLAAAETAFAERRSRLKLGNRIQLKAPRNFESDQYRLDIRFSSVEDIRAQLKRIERIAEDPNFRDILSRFGP